MSQPTSTQKTELAGDPSDFNRVAFVAPHRETIHIVRKQLFSSSSYMHLPPATIFSSLVTSSKFWVGKMLPSLSKDVCLPASSSPGCHIFGITCRRGLAGHAPGPSCKQQCRHSTADSPRNRHLNISVLVDFSMKGLLLWIGLLQAT